MNEIFLSTQQMTSLFKITRQGLSRWVERGMPKKNRNQFPLSECLHWVKREVWFIGVGKEDLAQQKLKFAVARARREELTVLEREGSLIPREASIQWLGSLVTEAKMGFMGLPRRLCEILAAESDAKLIEQNLHQEIWSILRRLAEPLRNKRKKFKT